MNIEKKVFKYHLPTNSHKKNSLHPISEDLKCVKQAFNERIETFVLENKDEKILDPKEFFEKAKPKIEGSLINSLEKHRTIKFNLELFCEYIKFTESEAQSEDDSVLSIKSFQSKMQILNARDELPDILSEMMERITAKTEEFQEKDSGWALLRIIHVEVNINQYRPLGGSHFLPLPKVIKDKKACINIQNDDEYCFKWALISALFPVERHADRPSSYPVSNIEQSVINLPNQITLNFGNLNFPLHLRDIPIFEELNIDISINVFGYEENFGMLEIVGPFYCTKEDKPKHINLLLIQDGENSHYVWIRNISRLVRRQVTSHKGQIFLCNSCLLYFYNQEALTLHKMECRKIVSKMPNPDKSTLKFERFERQLDIPFVIYADFESVLKGIESCLPNPSRSSTTDVQEHIPCAFSYFIKCSFDNSLNKLREYIGPEAEKVFVRMLTNDVIQLYNNHLSTVKPMQPLTPEEHHRQQESKVCFICGLSLGNYRIRDHCHLTGKYRGPAHNDCNLKYKISNFFPIFFHNFSGYDSHLFIKALNIIEGEINLIPLNKELYISLSKKIYVNENESIELRFLDSFRFMSASIETLSANLLNDDFTITKKFFEDNELFSLIKRKGVFPYEYLNSWEKLKETQLPPQDCFNNKLTNTKCSNEDYQHAVTVWEKFECQNISDYLKVYLKTDVLLLTDIFENFRKVCKSIYTLDPCHYFTAPGLSWDGMLKYTKIELELLTDLSIYNFFMSGIRGGITQCSYRHSKANNKYMDNFNQTKESQYIIYLDANNLYGWAMSEFLPFGGFKWVENVDIDVKSK